MLVNSLNYTFATSCCYCAYGIYQRRVSRYTMIKKKVLPILFGCYVKINLKGSFLCRISPFPVEKSSLGTTHTEISQVLSSCWDDQPRALSVLLHEHSVGGKGPDHCNHECRHHQRFCLGTASTLTTDRLSASSKSNMWASLFWPIKL